ncbi:unnamed protein product [Calicophoron daubneyi]
MIDKNGNGEINRKELKRFFKKCNLKMSNAEVKDYMNRMDVNNDGSISLGELKKMFLKRS